MYFFLGKKIFIFENTGIVFVYLIRSLFQLYCRLFTNGKWY